MKLLKTALIIVDETETAGKIAEAVSSALPGYQVAVRRAEEFAGTDLLPVSVFFLGCGTPAPASFAYIAEMFRHINLAGRPCGVFSSDKQALDYLAGLIEPSEASAGTPLFVKDGDVISADIEKWVQGILEMPGISG